MEEDEEVVSLFDDSGQPRDIPEAVEASPQKDEAPAFQIPEKFKDKSLEEVIQSYVHLEKEYGNKSNEVGDLRKWADQLLQANTQQSTHALQEQVRQAENIDDVGFDDFINDPAEAVNRALQHNPTIKKMEQLVEQQAANASRERLLAAHPDADEVVSSPQFQSWLNESPGRLQMLQSAHINRNVDVATDLLNLYKSTKAVTNEEAITEREAKAEADLKKATVEAGNANPGGPKKPIFKRADLINLRVYNPQKYEEMRDVINLAYAEKRVR